MRVRWTPASADDLQQIGEYLKEHNPTVAQPTLVVPPLPYVIVYEVDEETVNISRVLHGAQDWPSQKRLR